MPKSNALLFESGRFPLWFRVREFVFGLLALWFALAIASHGLFGVSLVLPMSGVRGSHFFGSLGCFVIAAAWIFVWFAQLQILFDELRQELVVRTRGYFRSHERRFPLAGSREVHLRHVYSGLVSTTWRITVEFPDGRSELVTCIPSGMESLAQSLEAATKLPVRRYELAA